MTKDFNILYRILFAFFLISLYDFVFKLDNLLTIISYISILLLLTFDMILFLIERFKNLKK